MPSDESTSRFFEEYTLPRLETLADDNLYLIYSFLNFKDILLLRQVSKEFNRIFYEWINTKPGRINVLKQFLPDSAEFSDLSNLAQSFSNFAEVQDFVRTIPSKEAQVFKPATKSVVLVKAKALDQQILRLRDFARSVVQQAQALNQQIPAHDLLQLLEINAHEIFQRARIALQYAHGLVQRASAIALQRQISAQLSQELVQRNQNLVQQIEALNASAEALNLTILALGPQIRIQQQAQAPLNQLLQQLRALAQQAQQPIEAARALDQQVQVLSQQVGVIQPVPESAHTDQVWHVSFSHDGLHFVTVSNNSYMKVWTSQHPCKLIFSHNLQENPHGLEYLVFSQFSPDDQLLAVCGKIENRVMAAKVAIFNATITPEGDRIFTFRVHFSIDPYDAYVVWYDNHYLMGVQTASLHNANFDSVSSIICYDVRNNVTKVLCNFFNNNASNVRMLRLSSYVPDHLRDSSTTSTHSYNLRSKNKDSGAQTLIFTKGALCFSPHQLALKVMAASDVYAPTNQAENPSAVDIVTAIIDGQPLNGRRPQDYLSVPDRVMELEGAVIGMAVAEDQRRVMVNVRPWIQPVSQITDVLKAPQIEQKIQLRIFSLETLEFEPRIYRAHIGYTTIDCCFLMFLSSSWQFYASGSEDRKAYIWSRKTGCVVAALSQEDVTSAAVFNPTDPEMLVAVSDDCSVKIVRSRKAMDAIAASSSSAERDIKPSTSQHAIFGKRSVADTTCEVEISNAKRC